MRMGTRVWCVIAVSIVAATVCHAQANDSDAGGATTGTEQTRQQKAEAGDSKAQNELGIIAQDNHDYREAFKWFHLAANQGSSGAEVSLGFLYEMGLGTEKEMGQAAHWYSLAAAQGDPDGEFGLGMCYLHGEGVEQNQTLAKKWFSSALGHGDGGRSANGIGLTYEDGQRDYAEAFHWYLKEPKWGLVKRSTTSVG